MTVRSDVQAGLAEQRRRPDWPSEQYLKTRFALQVAYQLEELRQKRDLSYDDVAKRAGTSKAHVIRMLSGDYTGMSNKSLAKIAAALGAEIEVKITDARAAQTRPRPVITARSHTATPVAGAPLLARTARR